MFKLLVPIALGFCLFMPEIVSAQNLGVGTPTPSEKLEVQGKVYSNQGGFKFPDGTVQTTAAAQTDPEGESPSRLFGAMEVTGIQGDYNSGPIVDAIKVYDLNILTESSAGTTTPPLIELLVEVEKSTDRLFEKYVNGAVINEVLIHLLDNTESRYFVVGMELVIIDRHNLKLVHVGNGEYAHVLALTLAPAKLSFSNLIENTCYCWNWQSNISCGCID
jgi:hypothetical protein